MSHHNQPLLERAQHLLELGQIDQAIETLIRLLGDDPEHADAHALLALCLIRRKRLHAARLEAECAAELEPESAFAHLAMGAVLVARREFKLAEQHYLSAQQLDPESDRPHAHLAALYSAWGMKPQAMDHAVQACEFAPENASNWALRGHLEFSAGNRIAAREHALAALQIDPENLDALVLVGHCELAAGDVTSAREHAAWALRIDPTDASPLTLLGAIKARESVLLGLWWRLQNFLSAGSNQRMVLMLVGVFLLYRAVMIALDENGMGHLVGPLSFLWLAFCAYTWIAPTLFWKSVRREMETVSLRSDY